MTVILQKLTEYCLACMWWNVHSTLSSHTSNSGRFGGSTNGRTLGILTPEEFHGPYCSSSKCFCSSKTITETKTSNFNANYLVISTEITSLPQDTWVVAGSCSFRCCSSDCCSLNSLYRWQPPPPPEYSTRFIAMSVYLPHFFQKCRNTISLSLN